jgi:hypothetical protein
VLTGDGELGRGEGRAFRYRAKPRESLRLAGGGRAKQLTGPAAKLVNVSAIGKAGSTGNLRALRKARHGVSSKPGSAFRLTRKTTMVKAHR